MDVNAAEVLETLMIISFGLSWPNSIVKSYRMRSTKGKSLVFLCLVLFGYLCGIGAKILANSRNLAFWFYILNAIMVAIDIGLYFRNQEIMRREGTE